MKCKNCNKEFKNLGGLSMHMKHCNNSPEEIIKDYDDGISVKKICKKYKIGILKAIDIIGEENIRSMKDSIKLSHQKYPDSFEHSDKTKKKLSESMKKAHKEGRAWNIGKSRWNNKASYPEEFFMKVIENEFKDKFYEREFPVGVYAIDFAWEHKKLAIEIDGEQHERFEEYQERDKRKDKFLKDQGWKILRIKWKDMYHETKKYIKIAKSFID